MIEGVDYADARPSPAGLYAVGKRFAVRYGGPGRSSKQLSAVELRGLIAAGLSVVANAEGAANGYSGRATGRSWAQQAEDHFRALGMPADRPIYFSVDWNAGTSDWAGIDAALAGSAEVIGADRVGVYGGYNTIAHCARAKTARWLWQTYAWSGGKWWSGAHLQQYHNGVRVAGGDCDLNRALTADYGQWGQKEDVMARLDDDDRKWFTDTFGPLLSTDRTKNPLAQVQIPLMGVPGDTKSRALATYLGYTDANLNSVVARLTKVINDATGSAVNEDAIVAGVLAGLSGAALGDAVVAALKALPEETARATVEQIRAAFAQ